MDWYLRICTFYSLRGFSSSFCFLFWIVVYTFNQCILFLDSWWCRFDDETLKKNDLPSKCFPRLHFFKGDSFQAKKDYSFIIIISNKGKPFQRISPNKGESFQTKENYSFILQTKENYSFILQTKKKIYLWNHLIIDLPSKGLHSFTLTSY